MANVGDSEAGGLDVCIGTASAVAAKAIQFMEDICVANDGGVDRPQLSNTGRR